MPQARHLCSKDIVCYRATLHVTQGSLVALHLPSYLLQDLAGP